MNTVIVACIALWSLMGPQTKNANIIKSIIKIFVTVFGSLAKNIFTAIIILNELYVTILALLNSSIIKLF